MRESKFIKQNQEKWEEFEGQLDKKSKNPDKLNRLFIQIMDDLSYARTFYPNRSVRVYLNNLAQQIFFSVYGSRQNRSGRFVNFWKAELPRLVYESRGAFRVSFAIFLLSMIIGAFSAQMDPEFPRVILGDAYVDMTIANIEDGDPMAVYKEKGQMGMSLGITANNLFVAFLTFVLGALFCVGTIAVLINNGVMVGSFQHFFYEKGVFQESFLTIWTHGTLEISAIVIAGAAGLTMGSGLVFPGTLSRVQAFQISARRGLKIMLGLVPIFIVAGFIEGYLTRFTDTPDAVRLMFILICLFFILGYFVWYPVKKAREGFVAKNYETELTPDSFYAIDYTKIKSSGEMVSDTVVYLKTHLTVVIRFAALAALVYTTAIYLITGGAPEDFFGFQFESFGMISGLGNYFYQETLTWLPLVNIIVFTGLGLAFYLFFNKNYYSTVHGKTPDYQPREMAFFTLNVLVGSLLLCGVAGIGLSLGWVVFLILPFLLLGLVAAFHGKTHFLKGIAQAFSLSGRNLATVASLYITLILLSMLIFFIMETSLTWFFLDFLGWNIYGSEETFDKIVNSLLVFMTTFLLYSIGMMLMTGFGFLYFSLVEIKEAPWLKNAVEGIGGYRSIRGMERE